MSDATMGLGMLMFPQMYQQLQSGKDGEKEQKVTAVCPHCGTVNDYPYKFCKECGKSPIAETFELKLFKVCPCCGTSLDLPKPPRFCPFCREQIQ